MAEFPQDIADIIGNYEARHAAGESYLHMAEDVARVGDARLSAVLRGLHRGKDPRAKKDPPVARVAGNKAVTTEKGKAD